MHSLSVASGVAIARLLPHPTSSHAGQAATLVERARLGLVLGPSELTAALMFAQPLLKAWPEHWRFAYLIGLNLGVKYLLDGFFINDIRRFVTEEFAGALEDGRVQSLWHRRVAQLALSILQLSECVGERGRRVPDPLARAAA
mmetsp:Transcript_13048/g.32570  ORF Transcript_13048/g.32570 Transcript_13048/m.32570 type:complete len:143 (-) Transcript_13048:692-1120(-)